MKEILKRLLGILHIHITRNQQYDACTRKILRHALHPGSCCVDVGCHKGEILDLMIRHAPEGTMFGFEPIPGMYRHLAGKYRQNPQVRIFDVALSDSSGTSTFQHVLSAPAYSGMKKRKYDRPHIEIEEIQVIKGKLDDYIPEDVSIGLIKIDVEGAEYQVLIGASRTIRRSKPLIIFEFGMGAADCYGTTPGHIFRLLCEDYGLKLNTLRGYLHDTPPLDEKGLTSLYSGRREYYFIAYP